MPLALYVYLFLEMLIVAAVDLKTKKIRNYWTITHMVLALVLFVALPEFYTLSWDFFLYPGAWFVGGYILYLLKIMGAGDVKYISTLFLLIPKNFHEEIMVHILIVTCLVGFFILFFRFLSKRKEILLMLSIGDISLQYLLFGSKFSYAPVILIAWMLFGWSKISDFF